MNLEPFLRINPCGYAGMQMVQCKDLNGPQSVSEAAQHVTQIFARLLGYEHTTEETGFAKDYVKAS